MTPMRRRGVGTIVVDVIFLGVLVHLVLVIGRGLVIAGRCGVTGRLIFGMVELSVASVRRTAVGLARNWSAIWLLLRRLRSGRGRASIIIIGAVNRRRRRRLRCGRRHRPSGGGRRRGVARVVAAEFGERIVLSDQARQFGERIAARTGRGARRAARRRLIRTIRSLGMVVGHSVPGYWAPSFIQS